MPGPFLFEICSILFRVAVKSAVVPTYGAFGRSRPAWRSSSVSTNDSTAATTTEAAATHATGRTLAGNDDSIRFLALHLSSFFH